MVKRKLAQKVNYDQLLPGFETQEEVHQQDVNLVMISKIKFFNTFDYFVFSCLILLCLIYCMTFFDGIHWHLSAISRLMLIKILPIYDWMYMKNQFCLIERNTDVPTEIFFNCDLCENVNRIDVYENIIEKSLEEKYIDLDVPVLLTNGLEQWPKNSSFLNKLSLETDFSSSFPCKLSSSIMKGLGTSREILEKARIFDEFFLHFQNCDQDAMRALRRFTFKPEILPETDSPTTYNWIIWNKHYNSSFYKTVELVEKLTVYGQIMGSTHIKLIPRGNCGKICSTLNFQLIQGEMLVFTGLWDLEYKCNEIGENLAIIIEIRH